LPAPNRPGDGQPDRAARRRDPSDHGDDHRDDPPRVESQLSGDEEGDRQPGNRSASRAVRSPEVDERGNAGEQDEIRGDVDER
jgi:hypothetical protein